MNRHALPSGHTIKMPNGAEYTINRLIGEGGFALVYSADTVGEVTSVVIKEFFPAEGAFRNEAGTVCPESGCEEWFQRKRKQFESEGFIGGRVSEACFQTVAFLTSGNGYAVMKLESQDMRSVFDLVESWESHPPVPFTGDQVDRDPVFPDMVRVRYALQVVESVLVALSAVHNSGYLHLDISRHNVIWAGHDVETGEHCEAFLADFGCSVEMDDGAYQSEYRLSYSPGFAAPEVNQIGSRLTPATDLYAVGVLLFYLCVGECALENTCDKTNHIWRELKHLSIPQRILAELQRILITATAKMPDRYQDVGSMREDIRTLKHAIPIHPLNADNSNAFTLYSLKSMLVGSEDTHYSWADELQDRRGTGPVCFPPSVYSGISWKEFRNDEHFLSFLLPGEIYNALMTRIVQQPDRKAAVRGVLSCNYDFSWKRDICRKIRKYGTRRLLEISRSLLNDKNAFFVDQGLLFQLLGEEGERLIECYYDCGADMRRAPYVGLAMFILFALLGPDGFKALVPSPQRACDLFFAL